MDGDIGWGGLAASLVLVAVAVTLSLWRRLGLEGSMVWASARALVQLLLVGAALKLLLEPDVPLAWSWLWVVAMLLFAAETVRRRAREVRGLFPLALAAFGVAAVVSLGVLFGLGVFEVDTRTLIPLAGMMVGNSLSATVLVARRVHDELRDQRDEVEARLALGQPSVEAARPYVRRALRTALVPQIETTKAVGLVFLPGAMTGLILAGVEPLDAVRVQAAVMYLVLGSAATTTTVMALGVSRRLFTRDHRLVRLERPAGA
ncbi:MAG: iron export ABC transporter permease subunit FetB [Acidimicrobiia bacterium]|nr:iron export ABC transporter permease subunit FetB [Acidimicrobiia bacterium]